MFSQPGARRAALGTRNHPSQVRELPESPRVFSTARARRERRRSAPFLYFFVSRFVLRDIFAMLLR